MGAKNKNNKQNVNNTEQYYTYDPNYGFIPVNENAQNANDYGQAMNGPNPFSQQQGPFQTPYYGRGFGRGYGYGNQAFHNQYANPMQQSHINQMNAMQEQINQMQAYIMANGQNANMGAQLDPAKMQEIYSTFDDIAQGKAQPEKLFSLLQGTSPDFWKGLAIGAGAILLYNCTPLKDVVGNLLAGFMGKNPTDENLDEDGFYVEDE